MSRESPSPDLRDLLAGHIIGGLLTAPARSGVPQKTPEQMASAAYQLADAMLRARDLPPAK